jgi:hypothetical protein
MTKAVDMNAGKGTTGPARDLADADAWMSWHADPTGRADLDLGALERFNARLPPKKGLAIKAVDFAAEDHRAGAIENLSGALKSDAAFPAQLIGYYEGYFEDEKRHTIEIYGKGPPRPALPEPPKPDFL